MTIVVHTEILASLQALHGDVQRRFAELDRYRALKAIERTIADFPDLDDVALSLGDIRDRVQEQLDGTREFRALRSIERILPELSDVLVLLDGAVEPDHKPAPDNPAPVDPAVGAEKPVAESPIVNAAPGIPAPDAPSTADPGDEPQSSLVTASVDLEAIALEAEPGQSPEPGAVADPAHGTIWDRVAEATPDDRQSTGPEAGPLASEAAQVPSLAVSVAQLMAQAAVPHRDPPLPPEWNAGTDATARPPSPAERAA